MTRTGVTYDNNNASTKIYEENLAGGTLPELLINKNSSTWTVTISDLKGCSGTLSLQFKANNKVSVTANDNDITPGNPNGKLYETTFNITGEEKSIVLVFTNKSTSKNVRIDDIILTGTSSDQTPTTIAFENADVAGKTFTVNDGEEFAGYTATCTTEGAKGAMKYTSSDTDVATVDESTGAVTRVGYGTTTITAQWIGTEGYANSEKISYTIEYKEKVDENAAIVFSADNNSFASIKGKSYDSNKGNFDFVASNGKKYTFDVNRALLDKSRLQINNSTITSPTFAYLKNGYKVNVVYASNSGIVTLASGTETSTGNATGSATTEKTISLDVKGTASFIIKETGKKAVYINKIEIIPNTGITLDENADNTITAATGVNVTLKRNLVKGAWNTLCLPFELSVEQMKAAFGDDVKAAQLDSKSTGNILSFDNYSELGIEAGVPYLIKPSVDSPADGYKFEGVNITDNTEDITTFTESLIGFVGIYSPTDITEDVKTNEWFKDDSYFAAFLGAGNTILKANDNSKLGGFRAYFAIPSDLSTAALSVSLDGVITSINEINGETVDDANAPVYNLQGQRVNADSLTRGIYVKNGKKFAVK